MNKIEKQTLLSSMELLENSIQMIKTWLEGL